MLERSFGLMFYLKPARNEKDGKRFVYLRITVDGKYCELSTKRKWNAEKWNVPAGRATGKKEDSRELNAYLDLLAAKVYKAKKKLVDSDIMISAEAIKAVLLGTDEQRRTVMDVFQEHNNQMRELIGREFAQGTMIRYQTSLDHTRSFIQWKYNRDDMDLRDLDFEFISQYSFWLKSVRKCNHNTTVKYLSKSMFWIVLN